MTINYDVEDLRNKTITSPVIQGTVNSGTGLTFGTIKAGATTVSSLSSSGNVSATNIVGTGIANITGNVNFSNISFVALKSKTAITATSNGLALNANFYISITNSTGAVFYIPCADALW